MLHAISGDNEIHVLALFCWLHLILPYSTKHDKGKQMVYVHVSLCFTEHSPTEAAQ